MSDRPGRSYESLAAEILTARRQLRIECGDLGDNDWPDNLHLSDVIEKHLARPAAARIAELEEGLSKYRRIVAVPVDPCSTAHLWVPANYDVEEEREKLIAWRKRHPLGVRTLVDWLIAECGAEWADEVEELEAPW